MRCVLIAPAYIVKTWLQFVCYFRLLFALIWWKDDEKPQTNNSQSHKEEVLCVCLSPFTANLLIRHECDSSRLDSMQREAVSFNHFNLFPILCKHFHQNSLALSELAFSLFEFYGILQSETFEEKTKTISIMFSTAHSFGLNIISNHRSHFFALLIQSYFKLFIEFYHFIESKWIKHLRQMGCECTLIILLLQLVNG